MSEIVVTLPGLVLSNLASDGYALSDVEGWWDTATPRLENEARPNGDGDFDQDPVYQEARYVTVTGLILEHASETALFEQRKHLARLHSLGVFSMEISGPDGVKQANVRVADRIAYDIDVGPGIAGFELVVKAADPNRYGPAQTFTTGLPVPGGGVLSPVTSPFTEIGGGNPGRVTLINDGTADSRPHITVTGGLSGGFEVFAIETGELVRVERLIPEGSFVTVDMATGAVEIDGQSPITGYVTRGEWITVPAESTRTLQFVGLGTTTGNPAMTVQFASADR